MEKVLIITRQGKKEWDYWCRDKNKVALFFSSDGTSNQSYCKVKDIVLIVFNGRRRMGSEEFLKLISKIKKEENWNDDSIIKNIKFICHGDKDGWIKIAPEELIIVRPVYYSEASDMWKTVIKPVAEAVRDDKNAAFKKNFKCLIGRCKSELSSVVMAYFLPFDIDMQAIKILINEKKNLEQAEAYLKEMLAESTNYHKSILNNYGERFNKLLYQVEDQKSKEKVQAVLGMGEEEELKIKDLLERISNLKSNDIEKEFFNNSQNNQLKTEIISFHSWYEKLARTLSEL